MFRRDLEIVVISDVHLGTYGCHAKELLNYLRSINPKTLILNGDFIDAWQFNKKYFPKEHLLIIQEIIQMSSTGSKIYYLTGNHDDIFRMFSDITAGSIHLRDKLILHLEGKKYWFFHGDIFDFSIMVSPLLAKLAGKGYDYLIRMNRWINKVRNKMDMKPLSLAGKVKNGVKRAVKYIDDFEQKAIDEAIDNGFDFVVCGHIHKPQIRTESVKGKSVVYMNSGDWIENLTALEYRYGSWNMYHYDPLEFEVNKKLKVVDKDENKEKNKTTDEVIQELLTDTGLHVDTYFPSKNGKVKNYVESNLIDINKDQNK